MISNLTDREISRIIIFEGKESELSLVPVAFEVAVVTFRQCCVLVWKEVWKSRDYNRAFGFSTRKTLINLSKGRSLCWEVRKGRHTI